MLNQLLPIRQIINKSSIVWGLLDVLFPPFCCSCGVLGFELCPDCIRQIKIINQKYTCPICGDFSHKSRICLDCKDSEPYFDQLRSWGEYSGVLREVIQKIKFNRGLGLIRYFTKPAIEFIHSWGVEIDHIVPVPLSKSRHQARGYNQAALIAKSISRGLQIPFKPQAISRIKDTLSQVGLDSKERKENVLNAFEADLEENREKSVLVIDDITTTGSTLNECAKALKNVGARKVFCFTLAKTSIS